MDLDKKLSEAYQARKALSFMQMIGETELPRQLSPNEAPKNLRLRLWDEVHTILNRTKTYRAGRGYLSDSHRSHFAHVYSQVLEIPSDENRYSLSEFITRMKPIFLDDSPNMLYATIDVILRYSGGNHVFTGPITGIMTHMQSPYRVYGTPPLLVPLDEHTIAVLKKAGEETNSLKNTGSNAHLTKAMNFLSTGEWTSSVRESINAVESLCRNLTGENTLGKALNNFEKNGISIEGNLKNSIEKLYSWTNTDEGIRHALISQNSSNVSEAEAIYMVGVCASFCAYLTNKARQSGLLDD